MKETGNKSSIDLPINPDIDDILIDLQRIIKKPSVSTKDQGLQDCANLILQIMNKDGINAKLLYLDTDEEEEVFDNNSKIYTNSSSINNSPSKSSSSYPSTFTNTLTQFSSQ